jgi:hypothetical protein
VSVGLLGLSPPSLQHLALLDPIHTIFSMRVPDFTDFVNSATFSVILAYEPPTIDEAMYVLLKNSAGKVSLVLHLGSESDLPMNNALPWSGSASSWIPLREWGFPNKTKLCSIIASGKTSTVGHRLRHEVIRVLRERSIICDVFGRGYSEIASKSVGLRDYMFSIVIENTLSEGRYFTEKIIDSLAVGTIPLYWGTKAAYVEFGDAIIQWTTLDELVDLILPSISEDMYHSKKPYLISAQGRARWFASAENWLWENVFRCIFERSPKISS